MASSRRSGTSESKWSGSWSAGVNTFGAAGYGRDYTSITTWETDTDVDIVTATVSPVVECYKDAASYSYGYWEIAGATTSATYFRILRAASTARHGGVSGGGVKFAQTDNLVIAESYSVLEDVEVIQTANTANERRAIRLYSTYTRAVGCLSKCVNTGSGTVCHGIEAVGANAAIVNCIGFESESHCLTGLASTHLLYNCTAAKGDSVGIGCVGSVTKNCIGQANGAYDFFGTPASSSTHNLSKDATAPAVGTYYRSKTLTFVDAANDDYRLAATDTDAIGTGTDLSADATFAFDDDIAFTVRS